MASSGMTHSQTVRYTILASEHSGDDLVLWLRYLCKWVNPTGNIFSKSDIARIMKEKRINPLQKVMLSEAITPGTYTNRQVIQMNQPADLSEISEMIKEFQRNENAE